MSSKSTSAGAVVKQSYDGWRGERGWSLAHQSEATFVITGLAFQRGSRGLPPALRGWPRRYGGRTTAEYLPIRRKNTL